MQQCDHDCTRLKIQPIRRIESCASCLVFSHTLTKELRAGGDVTDETKLRSLYCAGGSTLALAVSIYNYLSPVVLFAPVIGISGTHGATLLILSTFFAGLWHCAGQGWPA